MFQESDGKLPQFEENLHAFMSQLGFATRHTSSDPCHWPPPEGSIKEPKDPNSLRQDFQTLSGLNSTTFSTHECTEPQVDFDNKLTLHVCSGGYCHGRSGTKAKECKWGFVGKNYLGSSWE